MMPHLGAAASMTNPGKGPMILRILGENPVRRTT
jgi:hypothetical protein